MATLGLIYGNGLFVAVGTNGKISSSTNGTTWTARTSGFSSTDIYGVVYGNGAYVAVGDSGKISSSADGATWTLRSNPLTAVIGRINRVGYGNGLFFTGGEGYIASSSDGTTWTLRTTGLTLGSGDLRDFAYSSALGLYLAVGFNGSKIALITSPDCVTWTNGGTQFPAALGDVTRVAVQDNRAVAISGGYVAVTQDFVAWKLRHVGGGSGFSSMSYVFGSPSRFFVCSSGSTLKVSSSLAV